MQLEQMRLIRKEFIMCENDCSMECNGCSSNSYKLPHLKFKKIHPDAILPKYQTKGSACFDFHACVRQNWENSWNTCQPTLTGSEFVIVIQPKTRFVVKTGLAAAIPEGFVMHIHARSGLAAKNGIMVANGVGVVDSDYSGELMVILYNSSEESFTIRHGDRIAQAGIDTSFQFNIVETDTLKETERGTGGLGSTGL